MSVALMPGAALAQGALPTGGRVAAGDVTIGSASGGALGITQRSNSAIINWDGFSVGQGNRVDIAQPGSGSAILNRVTGPGGSAIHGQINAPGRVFVVNPNGIFIGPTGQVNTGGGFVASTLDITDENFSRGQLDFEGNGASAGVTNAGTITVGRGGYAALLGGRVDNRGTVSVPLGQIGFGAGERVTLDLSGDGFLQVAIPSAGDGDPSALIKNSGTVSADGGRIEMSAATARNAVRNAINLSGTAEARSVQKIGGQIVLGGGEGGRVTVSGQATTRDAPATRQRQVAALPVSERPAARPAVIEVSGETLAFFGATLDVSGESAGSIRLGGEAGGGGTLLRAKRVSADAETTVRADGLNGGDGGSIVFWSDEGTDVAATLSATAGPEGGDGGFIEVSASEGLSWSGSADTRAPSGEWGLLLLDPVNITVPGDVDPATIQADLATTNVTLSTFDSIETSAGDITLNANISWTAPTTLSFEADNNIAINANVSAINGTFRMVADGDISFGFGTITDVSSLVLQAAGNVNVVGGTVFERNGGSGSVSVGGTFNFDGSWTQEGTLSPFFAQDFQFNPTGTFLRTEGGSGSATDPYVITDVYGLQALAGNTLRSRNFRLGGDIDASGTANWNVGRGLTAGPGGFLPIGNTELSFVGTLDGGGAVISGLTSSFPEAGLFGQLNGAVVTSLGLAGANIEGAQNVGGLAAIALGSTIADVAIDAASIVSGLDASAVGGVVGLASNTDLTGIRSTATVFASEPFLNDLDVGGVVGSITGGVVQDATAEGVILVSSTVPEGDLSTIGVVNQVGGIAGFSDGIVEDVATSALIDVTSNRLGATFVGGLVGANEGTVGIASAAGNVAAGNVDVLTVDASTAYVGGAIGWNIPLATASAISSRATVAATGASEGGVGGLVGWNEGDILNSEATGTVNFTYAGGAASFGPGVGGFAGLSQGGTFTRTAARGDVSATGIAVDLGGHTGHATNSAFLDSYSSGNLSADSGGAIGGFVGLASASELVNVFATGAVVPGGSGGPTRGLIGENGLDPFNPDTIVTAGFFDQERTGQFPAIAGEEGFYGEAVTTNELRDTVGFQSRSGWDFFSTWAPGEAGHDPALYAIDPVLFAQLDPITLQYGDTPSAAGTVYEGLPGPAYVFSTDTLIFGPGTFTPVLPSNDVGTGTYALAENSITAVRFAPDGTTSPGTTYRLVQQPAGYEITPAPLLVTALDQTKTYGVPFTFDGTEISVTGLLFSDTVDSATLASAGAVDTAPVGFESIVPSAAQGTGLQNYDISYLNGLLEVTPAPLTVTALDQSKTYGETLSFAGTEISTTGLLFTDTVDSATLASAGAVDTAPVGTSAITVSDAQGTGLTNYAITYAPGVLDVQPAPLTVTALDQSKTYGETLSFAGTEFSTTGLLFTDTVDSATLASAGAVDTAPVGTSAITVSDAQGTGLTNYAITYAPGVLDVTPAPLTIFAGEGVKTYGDRVTTSGAIRDADGNPILQPRRMVEAIGLRLDDTVTQATLRSDGSSRQAGVGSYDVIASNAQGTGLENYDITYQTGTLEVVARGLTITARDATKTEGETLTFAGTEFDSTGLTPFDEITGVTLGSLGAPADALVADSPFAITVSDPVGTGLANYDITLVPGTLVVEDRVIDGPQPPTQGETIDRPPVTVNISFANPQDDLPPEIVGGGTAATVTGGSVAETEQTLQAIDGIASALQVAAQACAGTAGDVSRYLACLSDSLDSFANELDQIVTDLPPGLENVAQIVRTARREVDAARIRAEGRLAAATSDAEREAIRREAVGAALGAIDTAAEEIRKSIELVRAEDPELAAFQASATTRIANAVDSVGIELSRAVGL
ncbi:MBG domain-containing protein [Jannaschia seohaensis]|nr:MBG domain-containing protein [Jannaschia seohaensis]